ncbi:recombinase family protein [Paraliobacillus ryukyuensis]|nr:recombinase family protein [Paraliobacillus ryukyuensis]
MYGKFLINIIGAVAQLQREQIAENVRDNMRNRALRGQFLGGVPPFGFTLNKETQKFELVVEEAAIVKDIFDKYLNGDGILKIRNYLNENNVLGRNDYSVGTLQSILKNIHYTGDFVYSKRRNLSRTKKKKTSKDEWITVENNHPQIVTNQDFLMVQDLLKKKNRAKPENLDKRVSGNQFLSGLITCNVCEHSYYHGPRRNGRGVKFDYYVCGGYKTKGKPYCNNKRGLRIDRIDEILFVSVIEILKLDKVMEIYNETANKIQDRLKDDLSNQNTKKERIKTLETEKNRYLELIIQSENQILIQEYEEEIQKRITEIKELKEVIKSKGSTDETLNYFKKLKEEIKHTFEVQYNFNKIIDLGIENVGGIFKHFIDNIRVQDDEQCKRTELDIQYKVGIPELKLLQDIKPVIEIFDNETLVQNTNHNSISEMLNQAAKNYQVCVYEMEYAPPVLKKR